MPAQFRVIKLVGRAGKPTIMVPPQTRCCRLGGQLPIKLNELQPQYKVVKLLGRVGKLVILLQEKSRVVNVFGKGGRPVRTLLPQLRLRRFVKYWIPDRFAIFLFAQLTD